MEQNKQLSLQFASISGKKVTADFTGGDVTSDVGVLVMRETANKIGIIEQLTEAIHDKRHRVMYNMKLLNSSSKGYFKSYAGMKMPMTPMI